jgi:hypothetical protein
LKNIEIEIAENLPNHQVSNRCRQCQPTCPLPS